MEPVDVLVVGAGPTGLVAAAELARHGARVRIVDRAVVPSEHTRAVALQSRTLEIFEDLGILRAIMAEGRRITGVGLFEGRERLLHVDMDDVDGPYPFVLSQPQPVTEAALTAHLATLGVEIERGVRCDDLAQDDFGVTATLTLPDGAVERLRCPWLLACDGGQSVVREILDIPFDGPDLEGRFALVDVDVAGRLPTDQSLSFVSVDGVVFFIPLPEEGRWRLMVEIPQALANVSLDVAFFQALVDARVGPGLTLSRPTWATRFEVRSRLAERFRDGRVFLLGDAAHLFSPAGGQNLNSGIQDAYNLAWKLALLIRGVGRPAILDSYDAERRAVARGILGGTAQTTRLVGMKGAVRRPVVSALTRLLGGMEGVQRRLAGAIGEVHLSYDDSPIVDESRSSLFEAQWFEDRSEETPSLSDRQDFAAGPAAGSRAPDGQLVSEGKILRLHEALVGVHHTLLLFDGEAATPGGYARMALLAQGIEARFGALMRAVVVVPGTEIPPALAGVRVLTDPKGDVHARYGAGAECLYVVRPDGHVGFRCQPIDGGRLDAWLGRIFL